MFPVRRRITSFCKRGTDASEAARARIHDGGQLGRRHGECAGVRDRSQRPHRQRPCTAPSRRRRGVPLRRRRCEGLLLRRSDGCCCVGDGAAGCCCVGSHADGMCCVAPYARGCFCVLCLGYEGCCLACVARIESDERRADPGACRLRRVAEARRRKGARASDPGASFARASASYREYVMPELLLVLSKHPSLRALKFWRCGLGAPQARLATRPQGGRPQVAL